MNARFSAVSAAAFCLLPALLFGAPLVQALAASAVAALDTDNDSTVDLAEAKAAAAKVFDQIEKDNDGTLDPKEMGGRVSKKVFKGADPDNDGTLTKEEYLTLSESLFTAADPDKDGTLDEQELRSKAGRAFLRLVQ